MPLPRQRNYASTGQTDRPSFEAEGPQTELASRVRDPESSHIRPRVEPSSSIPFEKKGERLCATRASSLAQDEAIASSVYGLTDHVRWPDRYVAGDPERTPTWPERNWAFGDFVVSSRASGHRRRYNRQLETVAFFFGARYSRGWVP